MQLPARFFSTPAGRWPLVAFVAILLAAGIYLHEQHSQPAQSPPAASPPVAAAPVLSDTKLIPEASKPSPPAATSFPPADGYVGSAACSDCHPQKYQRWLQDWHPRALSKVELDDHGVASLV